MTLLTISNLGFRQRNKNILQNISFEISAGECVGLIGPNGAGKSTLMRAALGIIRSSGKSSLAQLSPKKRAQLSAWLPQGRDIAWPITVAQLVALGRTPWRRMGAPLLPQDHEAISRAITHMGLEGFMDRKAMDLSGGELARALIARALAQETPLLLADEPTAGLDPAYQLSTMESFSTLAANGRGVLVSIHDLGLAARYCDRLIVLDQGQLVADGPPSKVLSDSILTQTFGIQAFYKATKDGPIFQPIATVN